MSRPLLLSIACLCAVFFLAGTVKPDEIADRARILHFSSIVVDTHDDTTQRLLDGKFDLGTHHDSGSIDIPRMKEGGLGAIFFSIYIPSSITGPDAVKRALDQIDAVREQVRRHPKDLMLATTAAEVRESRRQGKIAALMGVEGGHMIANDLGVMRMYAALGARYMTLTHSGNNDWADSSTDKPAHNGLTDFGKEVVREMNRLGMMVDISHVADKTFYDALEVSTAPLIASHSSCRAICDVPRNMTDAMIKSLASKGGVIQINYNNGFLSQEYHNAEVAAAASWLREESHAELKKRCGDESNADCYLVEGDRIMRRYVEQGRLPRVDYAKIVEHIDHAVKVAGVDHVGLGSDFDGAFMPFGMEDASDLPKITEVLLRKGYSESDIRKILGENILRVMAQAERVAKEMGSKDAAK